MIAFGREFSVAIRLSQIIFHTPASTPLLTSMRHCHQPTLLLSNTLLLHPEVESQYHFRKFMKLQNTIFSNILN